MASLTSTKQVLVIEDEDGNDNKMDIVPIITLQDTTIVTVTTTTASATAVEVMPVPSAPRRVMDPNAVQGIRLSKNSWKYTAFVNTKFHLFFLQNCNIDSLKTENIEWLLDLW